jgi:hypothetical protein
MLGAALRFLLFAAEDRVFTKGTVPIKALFGTVEVYHAIQRFGQIQNSWEEPP